MPWYNDLRPLSDEKKQGHSLVFPDMTDEEKIRTLETLPVLQEGLKNEVATKRHEENLLIASWNIKEFGNLKNRLPESHFYIAEIISKFDLVAIQEVKRGLKDLDILMRLLGSQWDYLLTDITEGKGGNSERFAYVFDTRRVEFAGLAGEIVLWEELTANAPIKQLKRTPYITAFKAGWKTFAIINVHLQPGDSPQKRAVREAEVELLSQALKQKIAQKRLWTDNLMMMGDFNFYETDDDLVALIEAQGFEEPPPLKGLDTNVSATEVYDRMFYRENEYFKVFDGTPEEAQGGVFKFFEYLFLDENVSVYHDKMKEHKGDPSTLVDDNAFLKYYTNYWRRAQMSDHYPIWIEMSIDSTEMFLADKLKSFRREGG
jgi:endonuclease/exonuclease/phosphatase family metal-dependent hydrolase